MSSDGGAVKQERRRRVISGVFDIFLFSFMGVFLLFGRWVGKCRFEVLLKETLAGCFGINARSACIGAVTLNTLPWTLLCLYNLWADTVMNYPHWGAKRKYLPINNSHPAPPSACGSLQISAPWHRTWAEKVAVSSLKDKRLSWRSMHGPTHK